MSYWNAKYTNGHGEYEITFGSETYETAKAVEKVCAAVIDGRVKSREDIKIVVHACWIPEEGSGCEYGQLTIFSCSNCGGQVSAHGFNCPDKWCKYCGAHMDEG